MKRRPKRQKPMEASGGGDSTVPTPDMPSSSTLTVFETKELLMENMGESDILDE